MLTAPGQSPNFLSQFQETGIRVCVCGNAVRCGQARSGDPESALELQLDVRQQLLNLMAEDTVTRFEIDPTRQKAR